MLGRLDIGAGGAPQIPEESEVDCRNIFKAEDWDRRFTQVFRRGSEEK